MPLPLARTYERYREKVGRFLSNGPRHRVASWASLRSGWLCRRVRDPLGLRPAYRRRAVHVVRRHALGDVLLATPALRRVKQLNPSCRLTFYTDHHELVRGLPFLDAARPPAEAPRGAVWLLYECSIPPRRHIARIFGDHLGLDLDDVTPSCAVDEGLRDGLRDAWASLPGPKVLVNRFASSYTPNKDWFPASWEALIDRLLGWATVVEVGTRDVPVRWDTPRYVNLCGRLSVSQLVAAGAACDLHTGPVSAPVHIAAAFGVPGAVVYGGYEAPAVAGYESNVNLFTPLECAPCWLRDPCPIDRLCLREVEPAAVEGALRRLWQGRGGAAAGAGAAAAAPGGWERSW